MTFFRWFTQYYSPKGDVYAPQEDVSIGFGVLDATNERRWYCTIRYYPNSLTVYYDHTEEVELNSVPGSIRDEYAFYWPDTAAKLWRSHAHVA